MISRVANIFQIFPLMFATLPIVFINYSLYKKKMIVRYKYLEFTGIYKEEFENEEQALTQEKGKFVDLEIIGIRFKSTRIKKTDGENKTSSSKPQRQAS
jgi:hypothetical protein